MPFNIAHITLTMDPGGLENLIVNIAQTTNRKLFTITVGCLDDGGKLLKHIHALNYDSFIMHRCPGIDWRLIIRLYKMFVKKNIHIVHAHNQTAHFYASIAAKIARIPVIMITEHSRHHTELSWRRKLEKRILYTITDKWIVVSDELYEQSIKKDFLPAKKIQVINNGVEFTHFHNHDSIDIPQQQSIKQALMIPENARIIIMVARLHPIKNHALFIDAFSILNSSLPNTHALLVGDGECLGHLTQRCKSLELENKIHFLGFREDIAELLTVSDVFVLCSKTEGLPISLLEACASKTPVVITVPSNKAGLIKNEENGLVVKGNPDALAKGILTVLNNHDKANKMASVICAQVKKEFSLTTMTMNYESTYINLLKEKGIKEPVYAKKIT